MVDQNGIAADVATIQKAKLPPLGTGTSWYEVVVAMGETQLDSNDEPDLLGDDNAASNALSKQKLKDADLIWILPWCHDITSTPLHRCHHFHATTSLSTISGYQTKSLKNYILYI